jgi:hypothetical protein
MALLLGSSSCLETVPLGGIDQDVVRLQGTKRKSHRLRLTSQTSNLISQHTNANRLTHPIPSNAQRNLLVKYPCNECPPTFLRTKPDPHLLPKTCTYLTESHLHPDGRTLRNSRNIRSATTYQTERSSHPETVLLSSDRQNLYSLGLECDHKAPNRKQPIPHLTRHPHLNTPQHHRTPVSFCVHDQYHAQSGQDLPFLKKIQLESLLLLNTSPLL